MHTGDDTANLITFASGPKICVKVLVCEGILIESYLQEAPLFSAELVGSGTEPIWEWLQRYSCKELGPTLQMRLGAAPFTKTVWEKLLEVPFGKTLSYQALSHSAGSPKGARAAGQAVGANPLPLFIPCHRVIASDGSLGGFSQGLEVKRRLLEFERGAG